MKTFREFINEMARETGINTHSFDRSEALQFYIDNPKYIFKKYENIGSKKYIVIQTGDYSFLLTNPDDEYLGNIDLSDPDNNGYASINGSESKIDGGFYNLMFRVILQDKEINAILSDSSLSTQAIKSYEKINKEGIFKIFVYDKTTKEIMKFSKEELLKNNRVVMISN